MAYDREKYLKHRDRILRYAREYHKKNKHKKKLRQKKYDLQTNYGLSVDEYNSMLSETDGICPTCLRTFEGIARKPCVDHDHISHKVRGIICMNCNTALGNVAENIETLSRLRDYLIQHRE